MVRRAVAVHGSHGGITRHERAGEPLCGPCREFYRAYRRAWREARPRTPEQVPVPPWSDPSWMGRAACTDRPDLWCDTGDAAVRSGAADTCLTMCPVLAECREWAADKQWAGVVVGGWSAHHTIPRKPPWGRAAVAETLS